MKSGEIRSRDAEVGVTGKKAVNPDIVDWLSSCKYGFIPYLQDNWTLHVSTIIRF
jgi:hypothetical protein